VRKINKYLLPLSNKQKQLTMKKLFYVLVLFAFVACNTNTKKNADETKAAEITEATINIGGLHCENCVASVTKGINELEGIAEVKVTLADSSAVVKFNASAVSIDEIQKSIEKRGYTIKSAD